MAGLVARNIARDTAKTCEVYVVGYAGEAVLTKVTEAGHSANRSVPVEVTLRTANKTHRLVAVCGKENLRHAGKLISRCEEVVDFDPSVGDVMSGHVMKEVRNMVLANKIRYSPLVMGAETYGDSYIAEITGNAMVPGVYKYRDTNDSINPPIHRRTVGEHSSMVDVCWVASSGMDNEAFLAALEGMHLVHWRSEGEVEVGSVVVVFREMPWRLSVVFTGVDCVVLVEGGGVGVAEIEENVRTLTSWGVSVVSTLVVSAAPAHPTLAGIERICNSKVSFAATSEQAARQIGAFRNTRNPTNNLAPLLQHRAPLPSISALTWNNPLCDSPLEYELLLLSYGITAATTQHQIRHIVSSHPRLVVLMQQQPPKRQRTGGSPIWSFEDDGDDLASDLGLIF
eukprot:TRINITY_DN46527_c0_g1_i1.p1 TRINITY_DN46527_c0_g1~~TRINITY_DN46527_c0_g1_i1.p1  ORF type:complete len:445 (+),score=89.50 TRINITY_DN46527_c0_g1_i1:145-1335(+)